MQKFRKTKIVASIVAIASLLVTTISPIASAAASFSTEGQVKNALYAAAAYECINNTVLQNTAIGNKRDSIIPSADTQKVFIGQWLGDANGQITCKDALTKTLGGGNITTNMLNSGQVLNGVYTQSASGEQQIRCNYGIVNSSGNSTMDGTYSWPQGYIQDINGNLVDKRSHGVIEVVFNESGPIRLVGATNDIDTTHTLESMRNWSIDWSQPSKICRNLVHYTEVYPIGQVENPMGEMVSMYAEVLATTDSKPFNEWGPHVDDRYRAWLYYSDKNDQTKKFTHTLTTPSSSSTQLELTSDAKNKLLSNISTLYLNGKTDVGGLLSSSADAKYILYGRYLFNGDGNGSFACGGVSVATDDPDFSNLSATDYWDTSQPYVATVNAYKDSTATSKTTFRTKFGGDGLTSPGAAKSIYFPGVAGDCKALAGEFNNITPTSNTAKAAVKNFMKVGSVEELPDTNTPGSTDPGEDAGGDAATPTCFNSAGSLGWILCPVLEIMSSAISGIYDNVVTSQFLEVESSLMDTSSSVYQGWQDFRNFANIIFAIMFIVVIFCQVTGIGISNYNIKKILPRLIMTVILVNISFILCQLAVDLSNILGYQLKKIFVDLAGETVVTVGGFVGNLGSALVSTTITGGLIAGGVYAAAVTWEFWLIPLLLFLLGVIISIIFFAIILGVRKAGVLILIVLAPVAIVCYSLPNTKKFFDRWFKMLSSLLLVFPICGLLMGGGQYASTLLLGAAGGDDVGFFMALVAMLVQVAPFFFIPALVKSSMAAMGNLGMKLSNFGSRVSGGLQRGIRGSEGVRETERRLNMRNAERSFNRFDRRIKQRENDGRRVSSGLRHRRSSAAARYNRMAFEDIRAGGTQELLSEGSAAYATAEQGARTEQLNKDIAARESLYVNDEKFSEVSSLGTEYEDVLKKYIVSPGNRDLEVRIKALQNILSETDAGREQLQNHMISAMLASSASLSNGEESGLSKAAAHLSAGKLGATYKAKNRSMYNMLGDLSRKQYDMGTQEMRDASGNVIMDPTTGQARRHSFQQVTTTDSQGNSTTSYRSSYYDKSGLSSYTAETLAGADEGAIDRIMDGISSGNIEGNNLQDIAKTASEALNSDTVRVQPKIAKKLRQIERAGFAASHTAIAGASDASLGDVVGRIQTGEINNNNGSTELTRIAQSAQAALRDQTALHSPETAERLNQILSAAAAQGAIDPTTHSHFREVDAASIKVRGRETPKLRQKAPVPQGWTESGIWTGGGTGPTKQQQIAYEQWARDAADVDLHNARINHPPTPPNP